MGSLEHAFAVLVTVLAAAAVIGALVYAITWEVAGIRRVLATHRPARDQGPTDEDFWRQQRALTEPPK
jgi:hypothetical protein